MLPTTATVTVPATTANIGPGFDCLGAALTLYNQFCFTRAEQLSIAAVGPEADRVSRDQTNLAYQAFAAFYTKRGQPVPAVHLKIELGVPLARGLGSSSTAIVGGLVGANVLAGKPLSMAAIAALATDLEGHPDNVIPALLGGCRLAARGDTALTLCPVPWHENIVPVVAVPDFELSTAAARRVLPAQYSRADAVFNAAHVGLLVRGLETGHGEWLQAALCDRLHQPYRQSLIPQYDLAHAAACAAGAWGLVISGAGPTLLALAPQAAATAVAEALRSEWRPHAAVQVHCLGVDHMGAIVAGQELVA